jgi:hypothetical protein
MHNNNQIWNVSVINEVTADINDIASFITDKTENSYYGARFKRVARDTIHNLQTSPYSNRKYSDEFDITIRRVVISGYKAAILYKVYDNTLEVIAIMAFHTLQNPKKYNALIQKRVKTANLKHGHDE